MNNEPIKITIQRSEDDKLEMTTNWDSDLTKWEDNFRTILKWLTFTEQQANELFDSEIINEGKTEYDQLH